MTHIRSSVLALLIALGLAAASPGLAQQPPPPSGSRDGITVHGHWVIQVENPDGTVVTRREFENELTHLGAGLLAVVLGHENSVGFWRINLQNLSSTGASDGGPCLFNGAPSSCSLWENVPGWNVGPPSDFKNLVVSVPKNASGLPVGTLELSGNLTASRPSGIGLVSTSFRYCDATVSAAACSTNQAGSSEAPFTLRYLPASIPVANGQVVRVWVTLSFS